MSVARRRGVSLLQTGVPILVVRARSGELNAFMNVCRHRGNVVAAGKGNRRVFACAYHAWTYALDGRLIGALNIHDLLRAGVM